jgi:MFS family permease
LGWTERPREPSELVAKVQVVHNHHLLDHDCQRVSTHVTKEIHEKWKLTLDFSTFASSAPTAASLPIAATFHVSNEISYLVTTVFLLGYVVGPLFWGPGSELFGRRPIFFVSMFSYTLFHLGQALAHNMGTLLVARFLAGFFAVAPLTNCGGAC